MVGCTRLAALLAAAALLATPIRAQEISVMGSGDDPISIPTDSWDDAIKQANATSRALDVAGYDVEEQYPGTPQDGWRLSLAVVGNLGTNTGTRVSGAQISYEAPSSSSTPANGTTTTTTTTSNSTSTNGPVADGTWGYCSWFGYVPYDIEADVDAGCKGVLSDDCVSALNEQVVDQGGLCYESTAQIPEACNEELGQDSDAFLLVSMTMSAGAFDSQLGVAAVDENDFSVYDRMVRSVFVGLVGFSMLRSDDGGIIQIVEDSERIPGIVSCLRADNITANSRPLEDTNAAGAVTTAGPGRSWTALAVAIAVVVGFS